MNAGPIPRLGRRRPAPPPSAMGAIVLRAAPAPGRAEKRAEAVDERGADAWQAVAVERRDLRAEVATGDLRYRTRPIMRVI